MDLPPAKSGKASVNFFAVATAARTQPVRTDFAVRPFATLFHIRELVAERRNPAIRQFVRHLIHKLVPHPRARAVCKDEQRLGIFRQGDEARYFASLLTRIKIDFYRFDHFVVRIPAIVVLRGKGVQGSRFKVQRFKSFRTLNVEL